MTQEQLEALKEYVRCEIDYKIEERLGRGAWLDEKYAKDAFEALVASFSEDQK